MPAWFGVNYSHRNSDEERTFIFDPLISALNAYLRTYFHEEDGIRPPDYYYNPELHDGLTAHYLEITQYARELIQHDYFNYTILFVIVIAGINIGVQSYEQLSENPILTLLDLCILSVFSIEAFLKILSEGLTPYVYFIGNSFILSTLCSTSLGPDWKWNNFDFGIVFMSLPFWNGLFGGGSLALLRLVRLMRLAKLIKKVPQLQMIVQGLTGGLSSISYIMLLLFLVFYLFAIAGFYMFSVNDPFHFGNFPRALITCFVCATLDSWSSIMYINTYGCEKYPMMYQTEKNSSFNLLECRNPKPQFLISTIYFILLVVITALVMLSLFIGAVTLSMQESLDELKEMATEKKRMERIKKQLNKIFYEKAKAQRRNGAAQNLQGRILSQMGSMSIRFLGRSESPPLIDRNAIQRKNILRDQSSNDMASMESLEQQKADESPLPQSQEETPSPNRAESPVPIGISSRSTIPKPLPRPHARSHSKANLATMKPQHSKIDRSRSTKGLQLAQELLTDEVLADTEESKEMTRKLRIGLGDLEPSIEDQPKTFELFLTRFHASKSLFETTVLVAEHCKFASEDQRFVSFVTYIIILAGVSVGVQTEPRILNAPYVHSILSIADILILTTFTTECILKLFGEFPRPWVYFYDGWNKFDFIIVVGSMSPGAGSLLTILRLLRLLRVLKLVKSLPQLAVIVSALLMGMESIAYIALILFLCFYVFAILGMILFRQNDPFNFGNLHMSMFTLFRCSTLDGWSDLLYVNIYGCDKYPGAAYTDFPELCDQPQATGVLAALYFLCFVVIGAQILLTLFIGVVTTSMEEAQKKQDREAKIERQLSSLKTSLDLNVVQLKMFKDVFAQLDMDGGGLIEEEEIEIGLRAVKDLVRDTNVALEIEKADPKKLGIDLVTFIVIMCNIPSCRHKRILRKTVKRWLKNKKKRGIFFNQPRKRRHTVASRARKTTTPWGDNAANFLFHTPSEENQAPTPLRKSMNIISRLSANLAQPIAKMLSFNQDDHEREKVVTTHPSDANINQVEPLHPLDFNQTSERDDTVSALPAVTHAKRGHLYRRASTSFIAQSDHEVDTAVSIGRHILHPSSSDVGVDCAKATHRKGRKASTVLAEPDEHLFGNAEPRAYLSQSPTFVVEFTPLDK